MALPRADMTGARPLGAIEATRAITPLGDIRQENLDRLVRLEVGKQFQAQILSRFNDGTFMVKIADTTARIALPGGGAVGDALQMTLLSTDPRPTFNLDGHTASAAAAGTSSARIAQALYLSNAGLQAAGAPLAESGAAPASLSSAGRLVADLLASARDAGASTALVGRIPLSNMPGAAATQLASALHDSLSFSGLFYESHVHQWANGERPLTDLLREPQAQGSAAAATAAASGAAPDASASVPPEVAEARRNLLDYFSTAAAGTTAASTDIDAGAAQMINRQLHALEQQAVRWQGELYPGQPMEWEVRRHDESAQSSGGETGMPQPQQWQSVVRFSLPSLGVVSATINLAGERVQINVRTESEDAASALRRHGPKLASALDVAGASLDALNIRREAAGDGDV